MMDIGGAVAQGITGYIQGQNLALDRQKKQQALTMAQEQYKQYKQQGPIKQSILEQQLEQTQMATKQLKDQLTKQDMWQAFDRGTDEDINMFLKTHGAQELFPGVQSIKPIDNKNLLYQTEGMTEPRIATMIVQGPDGKPIPGRLEKDTNFNLIFIEKKKFTPLEKLLLKKTIKLIVEYGALGAKIALKPSEISNKNLPSYSKRNHLDYGIITYQDGYKIDKTEDVVLKKPSDKENQLDWPNLKYFWFIPGDYLNREQINQLVNRNNKGWYQNPDKFQVFLGGCIKREKCCPEGIERMSKKIFSFHGEDSGNPVKTKRCFGYVRSQEELETIEDELRDILGKDIHILMWEDIKDVL